MGNRDLDENGKQRSSGMLSAIWKKLPFKIKLFIIAGVGALLFLLIIVVAIISIEPFDFLDFSNLVKTKISNNEDETVDYATEYDEYWGATCKEGDTDCTEEKIEETKDYFKQQKKYYKTLKKKTGKLSSKEQNIILTTSFYGYNIDDFSETGGAYVNTSDEEEDLMDAGATNIDYKKEKKSLAGLAKQIKKNGEEGYYEYLKTDDYLDDKPIAQTYYASYGQLHGLDSDYSSWSDENKQAVREQMVLEIKAIIEEYDDPNGNGDSLAGCFSGDYWLPIGSRETEEKNGKTFATGSPSGVSITSHAFARDSAHQDHDHGGTDFATSAGIGTENIIASVGGKVIGANDSCPSTGSLQSDCGGGFGNFVKIQDEKGYTEIYGHMAKGTVTVKNGDTVQQGQVLGKMGSSGRSTGPHLHFEMHDESDNKVDPEEYVSIDSPRPSSGGGGGCLGAVTGDSNIQSVCLSLKNAGYPDAGVAAALINFTSEAHYDSACVNSIGAAGMAQWYQGRYTQLVNNYGEDWVLVQSQIEYYIYELDNEVKPGSKAILMGASDVGSTAEHFCNVFEVPGASECAKRNSSSMSEKYLSFVKNGCQGNVVRMGPDTADCVQRHGEFSEDLQ